MEELSKLIFRFEPFIKRTLIPSSSFWMMFVLFDIYYNNKAFLYFLEKDHHIIMILFLFIIFLGVSVLLNLLQQFIYDNNLKDNFDGFLSSESNKILKEERDKVAIDLKLEHYTDNILYQKIAKNMDTKRYVDDVKTIGIFFVSLLIMTPIIVYNEYLTNWNDISKIFLALATIFVMYIIYFVGKEMIKYKYRSRAMRIYTNYFMDD